ncbi:transporter substrate-binding domain-containing protein [Paucibacter sp. TC2R-5]|uniref:substrate-binding periplasmic protein n=1 Tax=Paucibacter sp. TC2R-5 TaxID=2893555 RepID=UPI0021E38EFE|nr:transporter substrate-binding domain-containing protein [Paucibacter sp. TC2R-5]MCV2359891.1 transporter substrate-binding domain-containing protein [Paucibacter sp. TC2R-5]
MFLAVAQAVGSSRPTLRVIVDSSTEMPWAQLQADQVMAGLHLDLGLALAEQLGREAQFLVLPRKRIAAALTQGQGDIVCALRPQWFAGPFDWSQPLLPEAELILSAARAKRPRTLTDLSGLTIGTVNGFVYPELDQALGSGFVREDAPNAGANLRKLNQGRMDYAVSNQRYAEFQRRQGVLSLALHPDFVLSRHAGSCALSRRSEVKLEQLNQAITALEKSGALSRMAAAYR